MRSDRCYMLRPDRSLSIRRNMAIGDAVACTAVAQRLSDIGVTVTFQTDAMIAPVVERSPGVARAIPSQPVCDINLDGAYENDPRRTERHFHEMFFEKAQQQLARFGILLGPPTNCRPRLMVAEPEVAPVRAKLAQFPRPWVFICPRSNTYNARTVPDGTWELAAPDIKGTCFWMGWGNAPKGIVDLNNHSIAQLPLLLAVADLLVTVDTGPMHIAAALNIPIVAILQSSSPELHLTDQNDFSMVAPDLGCLNCQKTTCPIAPYVPPCQNIHPSVIARAVNRRLSGILENTTSAIIPIYRPPVERLNKCLEAVLPQVSEVVVTVAGDGVTPFGANPDPKIRYVRTPKRNIGFGKNVNFGVRHSSGRNVLILNDDVYLAPDAVAKLNECMRGNVAIVGQLLRYPNNTIYHGGVTRGMGSLDWGHIDHGRYEASIRQPVELEQVTAASILVSRRAFYEVGGFDEDFFMYCEDNDLCMRVRQAGWKVFYTPHATGIHDASQSSQTIPNISGLMRDSIALFHEKWDWYLRKNINTPLGTFS